MVSRVNNIYIELIVVADHIMTNIYDYMIIKLYDYIYDYMYYIMSSIYILLTLDGIFKCWPIVMRSYV